MRGQVWFAGVICAALVLPPLQAQESEEELKPFIYATYHQCALAGQDRADEIVDTVDRPVLEKALADGEILAWGWLAHHTGGKWRRVNYVAAPDLKSLLEITGEIQERIDAADAAANAEFAQICGAHDDYIWRAMHGSGVADQRGEVGFSVYYDCDIIREGRADELVAQVIGPVLDRQVEEGKLASWGWNEHIVGGRWRRLATMTASDDATLLAARGAFLEEMLEKHRAEIDEFAAICGSHQDYIWNIVAEQP